MPREINEQTATIIRQLKNYLQHQHHLGQDILLFQQPLPKSRVTAPAATPTAPNDSSSAVSNQHNETGELKTLERAVQACTKCDISHNRKQAVFGEGHGQARLLFVGEAPGAEEDKQGRPFVGAAGQLLTKIIASIGLKREEVYICNVLKCRPTGNRNPYPEEIERCRPYLEQQLALIKPELICALGTFAAQTLLNTKEPISRLRGQQHQFKGIPVMPTFHPAALLYHPQNKRLVWEDMKQIAKLLNLPINR